MGTALPRRLPELESAKVSLGRGRGEGYEARVVVGVRTCANLTDLHARLAEALGEELRRAAGLEVARVILDVEKFDVGLKGAT